jgi:hypothetical protein
MSDPTEVLFNSPRSKKACQNLAIKREELQFVSKEELKGRIGNMKISKQEL